MLPIITLQNLQQYSPHLFDDIVLPEGADRVLLENAIMHNYGEMQMLYADWPVAKASIDYWFQSHELQLQHLWNDYIAKYNPVYNKDGYIEETRTPDLTYLDSKENNVRGSVTSSGKNTDTASGSGSDTQSGTSTDSYKGFQSSSFNDVSRNTPNLTNSSTGSSSSSGTRDNTEQTDTIASESGTRRETGSESTFRHEYGNIGVTMASQMLRDDSKFWSMFNWYSVAAKLWAVDNLVMVY